MRVGFHVSIVGSIDRAVDRAVELGCDTFQIFTSNPRQWNSRKLTSTEIDLFIAKVKSNSVKPVFAHMPYLPNLASPRKDVYSKSIVTLLSELTRCVKLGIPYLVTHLGSHLGAGIQIGFKRIINALNKASEIVGEEVTILLENTAVTRNSMGSSFEDLQFIIEHLSHPESIGICFDTCHGFAAGYDLRDQDSVAETIRKLDETIGLDKLKLVHLNDSIGDLNSHVDRHEHIGFGRIGEEGFRNILRSKLGSSPLILETPRNTKRDDIDNLRKVRKLAQTF